jgi:Aspartyl protease
VSTGEVRTLGRAPITFEVADGGSEHAPLVVASIRGVTTRLVLDSGSDVHLLTKELVDDVGLEVDEGEEGVDHSGATMPSWAVEDAACALGGVELVLRDVVAIPAPGSFPRWGIGGILSPQRLHESAFAVIDLVANELHLAEGADDAISAWLEERSPSLTTLRLGRDAAFGSVVVPASITPHAEIPTMLNTGGIRTEFSADALPGLVGGSEERLGGGVSGADVLGVNVGDAALVVAGHELRVPSLAVRASMHDPQGMVGMDTLQGTILAVGAVAERPVFWQIPAP